VLPKIVLNFEITLPEHYLKFWERYRLFCKRKKKFYIKNFLWKKNSTMILWVLFCLSSHTSTSCEQHDRTRSHWPTEDYADIRPALTNTAIKIWVFEWITQSNDASLLELLVSRRSRYFMATHQPWSSWDPMGRVRNTAVHPRWPSTIPTVSSTPSY